MAPKDHAQRRIFDSLLKIVEQRLEVKSMQSADVGGLDKPVRYLPICQIKMGLIDAR